MIKGQHVSVNQVAIFTFISWLGNFLHHRIDLPQIRFLSPEHLVPTIVSFGLFLAWWQLPYRWLTTVVFLLWAIFPQFLGGGSLSVLPFNFWPFFPPQTTLHYITHVMFAITQIPLIVILAEELCIVRYLNFLDLWS